MIHYLPKFTARTTSILAPTAKSARALYDHTFYYIAPFKTEFGVEANSRESCLRCVKTRRKNTKSQNENRTIMSSKRNKEE